MCDCSYIYIIYTIVSNVVCPLSCFCPQYLNINIPELKFLSILAINVGLFDSKSTTHEFRKHI